MTADDRGTRLAALCDRETTIEAFYGQGAFVVLYVTHESGWTCKLTLDPDAARHFFADTHEALGEP